MGTELSSKMQDVANYFLEVAESESKLGDPDGIAAGLTEAARQLNRWQGDGVLRRHKMRTTLTVHREGEIVGNTVLDAIEDNMGPVKAVELLTFPLHQALGRVLQDPKARLVLSIRREW